MAKNQEPLAEETFIVDGMEHTFVNPNPGEEFDDGDRLVPNVTEDRNRLDWAVPGGHFIVRGQHVNNRSRPVDPAKVAAQDPKKRAVASDSKAELGEPKKFPIANSGPMRVSKEQRDADQLLLDEQAAKAEADKVEADKIKV